jgi:hypothetical protein
MSDGLLQARRYAAAVEAICDTATTPEKWPLAVDVIAATFDEVGANLTVSATTAGLGLSHQLRSQLTT